jgi:hypothetical protein
MKPMRSFRPEPPPRSELWATIAARLLIVIGAGLALYCFLDAGTIDAQAFLAAMIFFAAVSTGVIIAIDMEREAGGNARRRFREVPPPFEIYKVWPPEGGRGPKHDVQRKGSGRSPEWLADPGSKERKRSKS